MHLLTRAFLENQHRNRAELRTEWLENDGGSLARGLIALSGARHGEVGAQLLGRPLRVGDARGAARSRQRSRGVSISNCSAPVNPRDAACTNASLALAVEHRLPVVATHPIQFLEPGDFRAHEARFCIAEGYTLADPRRPRRFTREQYFKSQAEMAALFADVPAALANTRRDRASRCNLTLELGKPRLPPYPTPAGVTLDDHCRDAGAGGA